MTDVDVRPLSDGAEVIADGNDAGFLVGDRSRVHITVLHDGRPLVLCRGRAEVRVTSRDRSQPCIVATDHAMVRVVALGTSSPTVRGDGSASLTVLAREESSPVLEVFDAAQYRLVVQDDARPRCHDWPRRWEPRRSEVYVGQRLDHLASADAAEAAAREVFREWRSCRNRVLAATRAGNGIPMVCDDTIDIRWTCGTVHLDVGTDEGPWLSHDAHDPHPFTEASRAACTRVRL